MDMKMEIIKEQNTILDMVLGDDLVLLKKMLTGQPVPMTQIMEMYESRRTMIETNRRIQKLTSEIGR